LKELAHLVSCTSFSYKYWNKKKKTLRTW